MIRKSLSFLLLLVLLAPALRAQPAAQRAPAASAPDGSEFIIGPDDLLDIVVFDVPEMTRQYRVATTGTIDVPLIDQPIKVGGLTVQQCADRLTSELRERGLVSEPHVTVAPRESRGHAVAITGAVRNPQTYPLLGQARLLDVLSAAGGLTDNAGGVAKVIRSGARAAGSSDPSAQPGSDVLSIDLKQLFSANDPSLNVVIHAGDWIHVPPAGVVYIVGAVNHPGAYPLSTNHQQITIMEALALAQDVKSTALRSKAMIVRRGEQYPEGRQQIPVDLGQLASGKQKDEALLANDILFVPDGAAKKALRRGADTAIQIAAGLVWHY